MVKLVIFSIGFLLFAFVLSYPKKRQIARKMQIKPGEYASKRNMSCFFVVLGV